MLFVCENNLYAMGTALSRSESVLDLERKAASYNVEAASADGMDVLAVETAAGNACELVRSGQGPYFLELRTYRFRAHSMFDAELYRDKAEVEAWKKKDPIVNFVDVLKEHGLLDDSELASLESDIEQEIRDAVDFAETATLEPVEDLTRFVYSDTGGTR